MTVLMEGHKIRFNGKIWKIIHVTHSYLEHGALHKHHHCLGKVPYQLEVSSKVIRQKFSHSEQRSTKQSQTMLQIRRGNRNNLGSIGHIFP